VARREEIAAGVHQRELEIVDRALFALEQAPLDEAALAVTVLALGEGNLRGIDDLQVIFGIGSGPVPSWTMDPRFVRV
jgi:hypothetical protein